jgi:two-component system chemotaxis sensor kinase CheA
MDDLLADFLSETQEGLNELEINFLSFETAQDRQALYNEAFRILHTLKGTCGFLGLSRLEKLAHVSETLLSMVRDGERELHDSTIALLFQTIDALKAIVVSIEHTGSEGNGDDQDLINALHACISPSNVFLDKEDIGNQEPSFQIHEENIPQNEIIDEEIIDEEREKKIKEEKSEETEDKISLSTAPVKVQQTLRVNVDTLDGLMNLVSELVLTRNQLGQLVKDIPENMMSALFSQLNQITSDLQEAVTKTRMQTIDQAWVKLPRLVRDTSKMLGKNVNLIQKGGETELDRQILELIKDPLVHMVRNSLDHGLEPPEERLAQGKSDTGTITLSALNEGSYVLLKIMDDGRGINVSRVREKLIENKVLSFDRAHELSEEELFQYLFHPGFSTAQEVTNVSGRGVGMDVVFSNIEKLGGVIHVSSKLGKGSVFTIRIPSTLSIISSLVVQLGHEKFALPQASVVELVQMGGVSGKKIEYINDQPILRLRDSLLPLVLLDQLLNMTEKPANSFHNTTHCGHVVIMQREQGYFGVLVDRVCDTYEIVVKPLSKVLRGIKLFSGSTILGDGGVVLILDPHQLSKELGDEFIEKGDEDETKLVTSQPVSSSIILIFKGEKNKRFIVPLSLVSRIDEIDVCQLSLNHQNQVIINYHGDLLPIISLCPHDSGPDEYGVCLKPILIFHHKAQSFGIIIDDILNIFEKNVEVKMEVEVQGAMGMTLIDNQVCYLMDTHYYFDKLKDMGIKMQAHEGKKNRILLVDDSQFFLNTITPILSVSGYEVVSFNQAEKALKHVESDTDFLVIITDINMPEMDGYAFSKEVKKRVKAPVIALSAYQDHTDLSHLKEHFDEFVSKSDQQSLLHMLKSFNDSSTLARGGWA